MKILYTIGHSNHPLQEFLDILQAYEIGQLIDIRTIPRSRHVPWFNKDELKAALKKRKIRYHHLVELGGLRHTTKDSINMAWKNKSFRGYADYMQTRQFFDGLKKLNAFMKETHCNTDTKHRNIVIMCAEALPWRCHRSLVADAEVVRGIKVLDIMSKTALHEHQLTSFAVVDRTKRPIKIYYP